ncbi:hypothetical protein [Acuticoccus sp.]|uniref:hypothetical protein n=1 Tax=Acuticoccus sp. TaxID=1904378 RepID=UPI003B52ACCB
MSDTKGVSRRTLIGGTVAVAATAGLGIRAQAQTKIPPEAVMYVPITANKEQFCANCIHWQAEHVAEYSSLNESDPEMAECAIVAGQVHSTGWCGVWAPAPSAS